MQWIFFVLAIIFYIYRFITKQRREQEEAQRRKQQVPPPASTSTNAGSPPENQPQPKTIDEILKEMHRRVETQNKPYAKPVTQRPVLQKPATNKEARKPQPKVQQKKEPAPFLTEETTAYNIEPTKIPSNMVEDFIRQGELTDIHNLPQKKSDPLKNFNLRSAVMAQIILQRPEW